LVAVEEVLAVEQHLAALGLGGAHAVADRGEVLLGRGFERDAHVVVPRLGDEADGVGLGPQQRRETRIGGGRAAGAAGHVGGGGGGGGAALLGQERPRERGVGLGHGGLFRIMSSQACTKALASWIATSTSARSRT